MKTIYYLLISTLLIILLSACTQSDEPSGMQSEEHGSAQGQATEPAEGPHGGRLLADGDFALELTIFESGIPPEYRVWATYQGRPVDPENIGLTIDLTRLGGQVDHIQFAPQSDFLRGNAVIYEPHSFQVSISADYQGKQYTWEYDNFEGRTRISDEIADAFGIETDIAGPLLMRESVTVYGQIVPNQEAVREVTARFPGSIQSVRFSLGDTVQKGQILATVESNESLNSYSITAPINGVITERNANPGEQTGGRVLFKLMNPSTVWASLSLFPGDRSRVKAGAPVLITPATGGDTVETTISRINTTANNNQSVQALAILGGVDETLLPGTFITASITVGEYQAPLAVKRSGLQPFRDFTVVYAKFGDQYEVRMLDFGRQNSDWVEVTGGLDSGTRYVTENSYVIKADIEKSGASHDH